MVISDLLNSMGPRTLSANHGPSLSWASASSSNALNFSSVLHETTTEISSGVLMIDAKVYAEFVNIDSGILVPAGYWRRWYGVGWGRICSALWDRSSIMYSIVVCVVTTPYAYHINKWSFVCLTWQLFATSDILSKVENAIYDNHILYSTPYIIMSYTEPPPKRSKTGGDAGPSSNPYLAHLNPQQGNGNGNGNGVAAGTGKNPLNGLVPRMVTTEQAKKILVSLFDTSKVVLELIVRMAMSTLSKTWSPSRQIIRKS